MCLQPPNLYVQVSMSDKQVQEQLRAPLAHYFKLRLQELDCLQQKKGLHEQNCVPE